ncbi:MAG: hypothetical protein RLZZ561_1223 [Pseudomonadota bacterium]
MDEQAPSPMPPARRSGSIRGLMIFASVAFVVGTLAMTWAVTQWTPVRDWIITQEPVTGAPQPKPVPVQARTKADVTRANVEELETRLAKIDARANSALKDASRAETLLIIIATRRAVERGLPLGYLETALLEHFGSIEPNAVAQLITNARPPVSLDQLQDDLDILAPDLLVPAAADGSWLNRITSSMDDLVVIRRADQPSEMPALKLDRARRALSHDRVDLALKEVSGLPGAKKAQAWQTKARRYLKVRAALDELEAASLVASPSTAR